MVDKRKLYRLAQIKTEQFLNDAADPAFAPGYRNPPSSNNHPVNDGYPYQYEKRASRARRRRSAKEGYTQGTSVNAGYIPRGSELDMTRQNILGYTDEVEEGFRGQPAPPNDSHPTIEDNTYYRRTRRNSRQGRKYTGQSTNAAFTSGDEGADISDSLIPLDDDTSGVQVIEDSIKRILKPMAVRKLRQRGRQTRAVKRS